MTALDRRQVLLAGITLGFAVTATGGTALRAPLATFTLTVQPVLAFLIR